jgi:hypothetical protein
MRVGETSQLAQLQNTINKIAIQAINTLAKRQFSTVKMMTFNN